MTERDPRLRVVIAMIIAVAFLMEQLDSTIIITAIPDMAVSTLSYADMPAERLSRATSLGGVLQQLSVSLGVSMGAMLLGLISFESHVLTPERFHEAFLLMAAIPLLSIPGFLYLRPEDGAQVSQHERRSR
ncbi:hypothetical protein [Inquilinus sp. OTU3971]|uniref:hypothetical protein n=1 Tax=Inquilinus sp. OTU3971 TaxID=3043855 RepID=UPI00313C02E2